MGTQTNDLKHSTRPLANRRPLETVGGTWRIASACALDLVFCPGATFREPCDLGQDGFSGGDPCKEASLGIDVFYRIVDFADHFLDVGKGARSNRWLGNQSKLAFHLIDPGCVSGGVMHVKMRTDTKPVLYLLMFMGTVVVYNKVDVKKIRYVCFNMF